MEFLIQWAANGGSVSMALDLLYHVKGLWVRAATY